MGYGLPSGMNPEYIEITKRRLAEIQAKLF
jgi:hypothetical protein